VRSLKREVEALYQNNLHGRGRKFDTEVFEMKRQLWLSSCSKESSNSDSATASFGRPFAAPNLPHRRTAEDMTNLIDDI